MREAAADGVDLLGLHLVGTDRPRLLPAPARCASATASSTSTSTTTARGTYERSRKDSFYAYQKIIKSNGAEGLD
jgi:6-phospho-beta-glucosidase